MGAGLLAVKSGFILFIKIDQFLHNKHALERERLSPSVGGLDAKTMMSIKVCEA
jgi:hypothetical protein